MSIGLDRLGGLPVLADDIDVDVDRLSQLERNIDALCLMDLAEV